MGQKWNSEMEHTIHMTVAIYTSTADGQEILDALNDLERQGTIKLIDAAMLTKSEDGKLHVAETEELTTRQGAKRGALVLGVVGLIFPPSFLASVLVGGGIGALIGRMRDTGLK
jgi:uncharacterized membrane protein